MARSKPASVHEDHDPELELLRAARSDFHGDPSYGGVRPLEPGELPAMLVSYGEGLPTGIARWAAEEAEDAAIGPAAKKHPAGS